MSDPRPLDNWHVPFDPPAKTSVVEWYRKRQAESYWRNLMNYASKTKRGQHNAVQMQVALWTLGDVLGALSNGGR